MDLRNEYQKVENLLDSVGDLLGAEHHDAAALVFKRLVEASVKFKECLPGVAAAPETVCPVVQKEADMPLTVTKEPKKAPKVEAPVEAPAAEPVTPPNADGLV